MTFREEEVDNFLKVFKKYKSQIAGFEGCTHLDLWQDHHAPNVFSTHSHWEGPEYLENYRRSDVFKKVWGQTKPLFADKPTAHSYTVKL